MKRVFPWIKKAFFTNTVYLDTSVPEYLEITIDLQEALQKAVKPLFDERPREVPILAPLPADIMTEIEFDEMLQVFERELRRSLSSWTAGKEAFLEDDDISISFEYGVKTASREKSVTVEGVKIKKSQKTITLFSLRIYFDINFNEAAAKIVVSTATRMPEKRETEVIAEANTRLQAFVDRRYDELLGLTRIHLCEIMADVANRILSREGLESDVTPSDIARFLNLEWKGRKTLFFDFSADELNKALLETHALSLNPYKKHSQENEEQQTIQFVREYDLPENFSIEVEIPVEIEVYENFLNDLTVEDIENIFAALASGFEQTASYEGEITPPDRRTPMFYKISLEIKPIMEAETIRWLYGVSPMEQSFVAFKGLKIKVSGSTTFVDLITKEIDKALDEGFTNPRYLDFIVRELREWLDEALKSVVSDCIFKEIVGILFDLKSVLGIDLYERLYGYFADLMEVIEEKGLVGICATVSHLVKTKFSFNSSTASFEVSYD